MRPKLYRAVLAALPIVSAAAVTDSAATTFTWTGGGSPNNTFAEPANWSPAGGPPASADTALLPAAASIQFNSSPTNTAALVTGGASVNLTASGTQTWSLSGDLRVETAGSRLNFGSPGPALSCGGDVVVDAGQLATAGVNTVNVASGRKFLVQNAGSFSVFLQLLDSGRTMEIKTGGDVHATSTINVGFAGAGTLDVSGAGSSFACDSATTWATTELTSARVNVSAGAIGVVPSLTVGNTGGGASITINAAELHVTGPALATGGVVSGSPVQLDVTGSAGFLTLDSTTGSISVLSRSTLRLLSGGNFIHNGGTMLILGGTFNGSAGNYQFTNPALRINLQSNGTFIGSSLVTPFTQVVNLSVGGASRMTLSGPISLTGGTFSVSGNDSQFFAGSGSFDDGTRLTVSSFGYASFGSLVLDPPGGVGTATVFTNVSSGATLTGGTLALGAAGSLTSSADVVFDALDNDGRIRVTGGFFRTFPSSVNTREITATGGLLRVGPLDGSGSLAMSGTSSMIATHVRQGSVSIGGSAGIFMSADGGPTAVSRVGQLSFGSLAGSVQGQWDLADNDLVIDHAGTSPLAQVRGYIGSGYNNGSWTGTGLASSSAATVVGAKTALGYAEASALFDSFPATFSGQSVDNTTVLVKYTWYGDADLDGDADGVDIGKWATNFTGELSGGAGATLVWTQGDWDYDGDVDGVDAGLWATAFTGELSGGGLTIELGSALSREAASILEQLGITVVAEPASMFALAAGAAWSLQRPRLRRSRR